MVDLTSFAVVRSLSDSDALGIGSQVEALVDVGARVTNIVIHHGGVPRFVRILLMGGQDITDAVAERMGVPQAQAEAMKQQLGIGLPARAWTPRPRPGRRGCRRVLRRRGPRLSRLLPGLERVRPDLAARPHRWRCPPRRARAAAAGHHPGSGPGRNTHAGPAGGPHRPVTRADRLRRAAGRRAVGLALGAAS